MTLAPGALSRFQDDFAHALFAVGEAAPPTVAALIGQPAFAVYRNTVIKACIDALQANYPAVNRLVGDEWMRAAAAVYVGKTLPGLPMLLEYGADFADFLAGFEPAAELPYLPGVARLDRFWTEAHVAATEDPLDRGSIGQFAEGNFYRTRLQPHAAARWAWHTEAPIYTIWARNRSDAQFDAEIDWCAEGALLTRPRDTVTWRALDQAGCAFLDACAAGDTVAEATHAALHVDRNADLSRLITTLLDAGVFSRIRIDDR